ncbi:alpha/beta fold hydrolase [Pyxidicoccus trucidator]|uniref:alpha/beta fold hydrolase n=1 Tax=Pyxidicoccus trucidator TaxID=2709662 RepID=UPI0013DC167C|nr:alpha/beta hydrolase [Pyxidicoccus trucidator]
MNATQATRTATVEGVQLHYEVHGQGAPLVLLHGFTGAGADWRHVFDFDALAQRYQLIVPDLRGHGRSDNPSGAFTVRQCATDVLALLDQLGIPRFRAIGLSLGGNTLLHIATREPARVERMVIVSSPPYYPTQARRIMATLTEETRTPAEWAEMRARHSLGDEQIRALWRYGRGFADSHDDMSFTPPLLATITAPTLIVYGDSDPLYPVELGVELYRSIPQSRLWVVPGGGHGPIFQEHRDAFARTALAFL